MNLTPIFEAAVPEMSKRQTALLGDRNCYIGSSDVAGCARKSFMQREFPKQPGVSTLLKFARGHAAEWLLDRIFKASGAEYDTQVEVCHHAIPLKAHIDFLFYDHDGLHAVEVKSVSGIPDAPYPQWQDQLHFQLGMLRLQYPKGNIGGSILAVDLNAGQVHQFNGYEYDEVVFNYLYHRALHLLDAMNGQDDAQASPSVLCGYCAYRDDCPAMCMPKVELPPEVEMLAAKYVELNEIRNKAEKELKTLRIELTDFTGESFKGKSDSYELNVSTVQPTMTVDGTLLKQMYPDVYPLVLKSRAGYSRLDVKPVRKRESPQAA